MHNSEQFSLYTAKIFDILFESFPVPVGLDRQDIINEFLSFNDHKTLLELRIKKDVADILNILPNDKIDGELKQKTRDIYPKLEENISELEDRERSDKQQQLQILDGTLDFLKEEGFIISPRSGGYRLTSKSFSHLNKTFKKGKVESEDSSYITTIKSIFSKGSDVTEKVSIAVAVKVIPTLLGIS